MSYRGAVAAGHGETVKAAEAILREGGNAFDAIIAAHWAACVVEPVLASLGGGGYLTFRDKKGQFGVYDFFVQTPKNKIAHSELDFYPIEADFGTATQEFHIGRGAIATPGVVKGVFEVYRDYASMPMQTLVQPAIALAKGNVALNAFQAYIFDVIQPIYQVDAQARKYFSSEDGSHLKGEGEQYSLTAFADVLDGLAHEGEALFYHGELAQRIVQISKDGGMLGQADLAAYQVQRRKPLITEYGKHRVVLNPLPSSGGTLLYFALQCLSAERPGAYSAGSYPHLATVLHSMEITQHARLASAESEGLHSLLDQQRISHYIKQMKHRAQALRGTTHISVVDGFGNAASMTVSNGEGCGTMIPDTGIMLNNMLGEEDLNPHGFHRWQTDQRMTSMMSPCLIEKTNGDITAIGSGGSNRIRSAILQVLVNLIDFNMPLEEAIYFPRLHLEGERLNIEGGLREDIVHRLQSNYADNVLWPEHNLFFGGAHGVSSNANHFAAAGDPRRGGVGSVL